MKAKKLISALLAGVMIFAAVPSSIAAFATDLLDEWGLFECSDAAFEAMWATNRGRTQRNIDIIYSSFGANTRRGLVYPDNFGGLFIDAYGNLVVLEVRSESATRSDSVWTSMADALPCHVTVKEVEFSYNELLEVHALLRELICWQNRDENPGVANVLNISMRTDINRVSVGLDVFDEEHIDLFRDMVLDSPAIYFHQSIPLTRLSASEPMPLDWLRAMDFDYSYRLDVEAASFVRVGPGTAIYVARGTQLFALSAGFRANDMLGRQGFVTAAHADFGGVLGVRSGDVVVDGNRNRVGVVRVARLDGVDAAFVELDPSVFWMGTAIPNGYFAVPPRIGDAVQSSGRHNSARSGTILAYGFDAPYSSRYGSFTVRNVIRVSHTSQPGDSGGRVTHGSPFTNNIVGIMVFSQGTYTIVSNAGDILRDLNVRVR